MNRRQQAIFDAYAGLRRIGYTREGAINALHSIGVTATDVVRATDRYEGLNGRQS